MWCGAEWAHCDRKKDLWRALLNFAMNPGLHTEETQDTFWNGMGMFGSTSIVRCLLTRRQTLKAASDVLRHPYENEII